MNTDIFSALAEPNRFQIVELLQFGSLTVGEIGERLNMRQPQASKHLRVLHEAGIVEVNAEANRRIYSLRKEPFEEIDDWLKVISRAWNEKFDRLDQYLQELQDSQKARPDKGTSN